MRRRFRIYGPSASLWESVVQRMIRLNRINGQPIVVNADLIEMLEVTPEVIVLLTTGRHIVVKQNVDEIIAAVVDYQRSIGVKRPPPHLIYRNAMGETDEDG